jgi:hypothetical protein
MPVDSTDSDAALMARVQDGDRGAFSLLVEEVDLRALEKRIIGESQENMRLFGEIDPSPEKVRDYYRKALEARPDLEQTWREAAEKYGTELSRSTAECTAKLKVLEQRLERLEKALPPPPE